MFRTGRKRIRLLAGDVIGSDDRVLVARAVPDVRDHAFPDSGALPRHQEILAGGPAVPVADHADLLAVGRPDREPGSAVDDVGAELLVQAVVRTLVEQEQIVAG